VWLLKETRDAHQHATDWVDRLRAGLARTLDTLMPARWLLVGLYAVVTVGIVVFLGPRLGQEIFPASGAHVFQLRFRAPAGTKFETTERLAGDVLEEISKAAGAGNVDITLGYVGVQPSSYPINTIFLWTGGSNDFRPPNSRSNQETSSVAS
jgi:multidrug efflux pump subunit AcrB